MTCEIHSTATNDVTIVRIIETDRRRYELKKKQFRWTLCGGSCFGMKQTNIMETWYLTWSSASICAAITQLMYSKLPTSTKQMTTRLINTGSHYQRKLSCVNLSNGISCAQALCSKQPTGLKLFHCLALIWKVNYIHLTFTRMTLRKTWYTQTHTQSHTHTHTRTHTNPTEAQTRKLTILASCASKCLAVNVSWRA